MINFLIDIQALIEVVFTLRVGPEHVPIVSIRRDETIDFKEETDKF